MAGVSACGGAVSAAITVTMIRAGMIPITGISGGMIPSITTTPVSDRTGTPGGGVMCTPDGTGRTATITTGTTRSTTIRTGAPTGTMTTTGMAAEAPE